MQSSALLDSFHVSETSRSSIPQTHLVVARFRWATRAPSGLAELERWCKRERERERHTHTHQTHPNSSKLNVSNLWKPNRLGQASWVLLLVLLILTTGTQMLALSCLSCLWAAWWAFGPHTKKKLQTVPSHIVPEKEAFPETTLASPINVLRYFCLAIIGYYSMGRCIVRCYFVVVCIVAIFILVVRFLSYCITCYLLYHYLSILTVYLS